MSSVCQRLGILQPPSVDFLVKTPFIILALTPFKQAGQVIVGNESCPNVRCPFELRLLL